MKQGEDRLETGSFPGGCAESTSEAPAPKQPRRSPTPPMSPLGTQPEAEPCSQASVTSSQSAGRKMKSHASRAGAWNAPAAVISMTETSGQTYGVGGKDAHSRYLRLCSETKSKMLGPMPPVEFLKEFLCYDMVNKKDMPSPDGAFDQVPRSAKSESIIYEPMVCPKAVLERHRPLLTTLIDYRAQCRRGTCKSLSKLRILQHLQPRRQIRGRLGLYEAGHLRLCSRSHPIRWRRQDTEG